MNQAGPPQLWLDALAALEALDEDDREYLTQVYAAVAKNAAQHPAVQRFAVALGRLITSPPLEQLDAAQRALADLGEDALAEGCATHARAVQDGVGRLPDPSLHWYAVIRQLLYAEGLSRRSLWRAFERDATSDRVRGWWGSASGDATIG